MLQRDVAEGDIRRVRRDVQRLTVGDMDRAEPIDLAEPPHRLVGSLEESGIEVARHHGAVLTRERTGHAPDTAADLDEGLLVDVGRAEAEHREVRRHLRITRGDELFEREFGAGLVVEDPTGGSHDIVTARLTFAHLARGSPRDELWSPHHAP